LALAWKAFDNSPMCKEIIELVASVADPISDAFLIRDPEWYFPDPKPSFDGLITNCWVKILTYLFCLKNINLALFKWR
jgi:hypothetical protein